LTSTIVEVLPSSWCSYLSSRARDTAKEIVVIVVTGATGTVGRQVVMQLSERGAPVRGHP